MRFRGSKTHEEPDVTAPAAAPAVGSGAAESSARDTGRRSDELGLDPGRVSGDPGRVSGDPGRVAGDPGRVAGDPGRVAGDPGLDPRGASGETEGPVSEPPGPAATPDPDPDPDSGYAADPIPAEDPAAGTSPNMLPGRERRRFGVERLLMRLIATAGIIGIAVAISAILAANDVQGWIIGLVVAGVSVVLSALLWSSRQL